MRPACIRAECQRQLQADSRRAGLTSEYRLRPKPNAELQRFPRLALRPQDLLKSVLARGPQFLGIHPAVLWDSGCISNRVCNSVERFCAFLRNCLDRAGIKRRYYDFLPPFLELREHVTKQLDSVEDIKQVLPVLVGSAMLLDEEFLNHEAQWVGHLQVHRLIQRHSVLWANADHPWVCQQDAQVSNFLGRYSGHQQAVSLRPTGPP